MGSVSYSNISFVFNFEFFMPFFISASYFNFGNKKIVFLISFNSKNFLIAFSCEVEFTPALITFFGRPIVLLVNDKKIKSSTSSRLTRFW